MIKNIAFVCYAVSNMPKARKFYEGVLGLKTNKEFDGSNNTHWVEYNIGTGTLALGCWSEWRPSPDGASAALEVDDFDKTVASLKKKKVKFRIKPQTYPSCRMAVIIDPDKNCICIHQKNKKK